MRGRPIGLALVAALAAACGDDGGQNSTNTNNNANQNGSVCGNSVLEPGEQCDQGGANSDTDPDACRTDCRSAHCGDGVQDTGEGCDDGNTSNEDACLTACIGSGDCCVENTCGDGFVDARSDGQGGQVEACDDGNLADGDDCRGDCKQDLALCGNGDLDQGETCDDGEAANSDTMPDACRKTCQVARCGDQVIDVLHGETCDGTNLNGLMCSGIESMLGDGVLACDPVTCDFDTSGCIHYECSPGEMRPCYPPQTAGCTFDGTNWSCLGTCRAGTESCDGFWTGQCEDFVAPAAERCDGIDNDCNGLVDDCASAPQCHTGFSEVVTCTGGIWVTTCVPGWSDVDGLPGNGCEVCDNPPSVEDCTDGIDNNCDGAVDCEDAACAGDPAC